MTRTDVSKKSYVGKHRCVGTIELRQRQVPEARSDGTKRRQAPYDKSPVGCTDPGSGKRP